MIRRYRLLQPYRINKVLQPAGHELEMPEQTGDDLVGQGYFERVPVSAPAAQEEPGAAPVPARRESFYAASASRWSCCGPKK